MKKIRNSGDWYLAGLIERCEPVGSGRTNPLRRGLTWLNHTLIQADSPEDAYRKAAAIGKESSRLRYKTTAGGTVQWRFVGIAELLRIHDDIGHGAEVLWTDIGRVSERKARSMARRKGELIKQAT
jgi:hypothetical protein